ncbi:hypothetical protein AQI70_23240 [Streptomyces curacoi]|uniref:Uncharacterized protein n=1 Tax=Streptomyces curacoi TaxID=146536 RepID=A0A117P4L6_9ACTN|nr:hypothetical protein AQI70_23240 [Streptomyces curacoi]
MRRRRTRDVRVARTGPAALDVFADGAVEEERLLRERSDVSRDLPAPLAPVMITSSPGRR